jgi:hypothetical protein
MAEGSAPSREFWEYVMEYGDDNGDVLDPLEYDQILSMNDEKGIAIKEKGFAQEKIPVDKSHIKHPQIKFELKSSAQTSSAAMAGERQ